MATFRLAWLNQLWLSLMTSWIDSESSWSLFSNWRLNPVQPQISCKSFSSPSAVSLLLPAQHPVMDAELALALVLTPFFSLLLCGGLFFKCLGWEEGEEINQMCLFYLTSVFEVLYLLSKASLLGVIQWFPTPTNASQYCHFSDWKVKEQVPGSPSCRYP